MGIAEGVKSAASSPTNKPARELPPVAKLSAEERRARRRSAFASSARELVASALADLHERIEAVGEIVWQQPDTAIQAKIHEEIVTAYMGKSMGDERLHELAFRRLAEETLRASTPKYGLAVKKSGVEPLKYFDRTYKRLFAKFGLGVGSLVNVDSNLHYHLRTAGLLDRLDV